LISAPVEGSGYELVDVEWKHEQGGWVVRVFIDGPGGISHHDCERVSRELSALLDVHDVIPHAYSLEVSSPGLNRPLRNAAQFRRFLGEKARVKLVSGIDGRRNYAGTIVSVTDDDRSVILEVDGLEHALPLADLEKANLEWDFSRKGPAGDRRTG
jgi:ribosome maturation factor RimP